MKKNIVLAVKALTVLIIAVGLLFSGSAGFSTDAQAAPVAVKFQPTKTQKLRVAAKNGAVVYNLRGKRTKARLKHRTVRSYVARAKVKGIVYRRPAGKRYMVRASALRTIPKAVRAPKPVKVAPAPAPAPVTYGHVDGTTLVFGDSISANDDSWWSVVRDRTTSDFSVNAIGGTGLISGGYINAPFASRLGKVDSIKPDRVIVAGGRNDWSFGLGQARTTDAEIRAGVDAYLDALVQATDRNGIARGSVWVMTPWGTADPVNRDRIVPVISAAAEVRGFQSVSLPIIPKNLTTDETHPTSAGSVWLAEQFLANSGFAPRT